MKRVLLLGALSLASCWLIVDRRLDCGNGVRDRGEVCDPTEPGNAIACTLDCQPSLTCGDAVLDEGEGCDDGNPIDGDGCSSICVSEVCGDGRLAVGEGCDDGNLVSGDGCSLECEIEVCGDGRLAVGEDCDDGNLVSGDGCSSLCALEFIGCGDGILGAGEACDDGNATSGDGCSSACLTEFCGDGVPQPGLGEQCDPGGVCEDDLSRVCAKDEDCGGSGDVSCIARADDVGCGDDCLSRKNLFCGDGVRDVGEQCDGGLTDDDRCNEQCSVDKCDSISFLSSDNISIDSFEYFSNVDQNSVDSDGLCLVNGSDHKDITFFIDNVDGFLFVNVSLTFVNGPAQPFPKVYLIDDCNSTPVNCTTVFNPAGNVIDTVLNIPINTNEIMVVIELGNDDISFVANVTLE